ncbi:hypothetical protein F5Y17DRAFT_461205 [Xylariaceae sp. FL0594]|nr:hypothetical protein F5Y17DRAFT_461205 [Xylariaceae sp. FL0594]
MKSFALTSLAGLAMGAAVPKAATATSSSPCPFNYPADLRTTTSHNGLVYTVISNNPATDNRALQLRANPNLPGGFYVGIDAASPVLLGNFREGGWYAQARDQFNQLYDLGPTGYLNQRDEVGTTHRYTVGFANATTWPGAVEKQWLLTAPSQDGTYGLYHDEPNEIAHGFILCAADHSLEQGPWYQLYYNTYEDQAHEFPGCEFIGVRTSVAPTIYNGECDVAGNKA